MLLGLIIYGSLQTVSGGYLYDRRLVEHLQRQGDQVEIFALPWGGYTRHLADNLSISLLRTLRGARIDILLQDELNHASLFWLNRRLRSTTSYPIVSIVHHLRSSEVTAARRAWQNVWQAKLYHQIERRYLASVDAFVCNSAATYREVARALAQPRAGAGKGKRQSKPHVVAPPAGDRWQISLSKAQIEARAHAPGPLRVLFVGNLIPRKGLHILLEALACAALPTGAVSLTVVGNPQVDPTYSAAVRRQAEQLHLGGDEYKVRVAFRGSLSDAELGNEFASHQVLAVPSSYEGFGIVYLEGMGFGLPAIAGAAGGAGEIIRDGENGFLLGDAYIAGGDDTASPPDRLAAYLARLSADRDLLARMSLAARRRFEAWPTWEETAAVTRRFLLSLQAGEVHE